MIEDMDAWTAWNEPRHTPAGLETPLDHMLVEIRGEDAETTRTIDPKTLINQSDTSGISWRPMIWAREGAAARQFYNDVSPEVILSGLDEFRFMRIHSAFEQIFEGKGLNDAGVEKTLTTLERRRAWCAERGIEYRFLVVPESMSVYSDKVPGAPAPSAQRPVRRILAKADDAVRKTLIYPQEELFAARARHDTFSRDDVHFTSFGAFITYRALMESLASIPSDEIVSEDQLTRVERPMIGGYGRLLGLEKYPGENFHPPHIRHQAPLKDSRMGPGRTDVFETEHKRPGSLVIFRTSNTTSLFPFLLNNFSRIVAVSGDRFLEDLIESEKPTVVVTEIVERYISPGAAKPGYDESWGLGERPGTFQEYTGFELPLPRGDMAEAVS